MAGDFNRRYQELNDDQKEAVDYIEGPLLVIAGPGTGKTQLLSLRAANILNGSDASADNILCLTFSEAGAQEMKNRLIKTIGEEAYKITVSTYHSFGSEIIRNYPSYFPGSNLRPINKLKADGLIRELQGNLPFTSALKEMAVYRLSELISDAKQAALTPEDMEAAARQNLAFIKSMNEKTRELSEELSRVSLKALPAFEKLLSAEKGSSIGPIESLASLWNDELTAAIEDTRLTKKTKELTRFKSKFLARDHLDQSVAAGEQANKKLLELGAIYKAYSAKLKEDNLYDFADMILLAAEALKKHDELRFNLQERYLYIMLDEYQDTNLAQAELIKLLTNNPASEGRPNVMAVGDDDQAIYAFQGAKHSNMLDFSQQYRDVRQITLKTNYRSRQNLIDLSSSVAGQIEQRLVAKSFKAASSGQGTIEEISLDNEVEQYVWLAEKLQDSTVEAAIIAPENKYLERASAYLTEAGIEVSYERREDILEDPLIDALITLLKLIQAINDQDKYACDVLMPKVLAYEFFDIPTEAVWRLSWKAYDDHAHWLDLMLKDFKTRKLALMFITIAANSLIYRYDFIIDQVIGISDVVLKDDKLKNTRSPFYEFYADDLIRARLFQNLMVLKEQFISFNEDNQKPLHVADFLDFIAQLKASEEKLINDFTYGKLNARVKLMTAHGAKGQEFESVYLLSLINEVWGPRRSRQAMSLPPNLDFIRRRPSDSDDERLRLLYVALTRAKNKLVSLSYDQDTAGKLMTPLSYLPTFDKAQFKPEVLDLKPLWQKEDRTIELTSDLKELLLKRIENYALSPSDLRTFLDIRNAGPQTFYDKVLLKYKAPITPKMDYGIAVHSALDWLQQTLTNTGRLPSLKSLNSQLETSLLSRRLTKQDLTYLKEQGEKALEAYYEANKTSLSADNRSEIDFRSEALSIGNVRLTGKVDQLTIDKAAKSITIVDYKTGKGYGTWEKEPKLHLYKYQLYFYKLLVENSRQFSGYKVSSGRLDFVEPDSNSGELHVVPLSYSDEEMERFKALLTAVWKHIYDLNFPDLSGYKDDVRAMLKFEDDLINGNI